MSDQTIYLFLQTLCCLDIMNVVNKVNWPPFRISKLTFQALALQRVVCVYKKMELCYWWEHRNEKKQECLFSEKRLLIPWGLRVPI